MKVTGAPLRLILVRAMTMRFSYKESEAITYFPILQLMTSRYHLRHVVSIHKYLSFDVAIMPGVFNLRPTEDAAIAPHLQIDFSPKSVFHGKTLAV